MKAIVLGAGRIGRGFVSELLTKNNVEIVFFDASSKLVNEINLRKEYTIHVLGHEDLNTTLKNFRAFEINDIYNLANEWKEADYIFTAVGGKNMGNVGEKLGFAFKKVYELGDLKNSNIITCENWIDPAKDLKKGILEVLNEEEKEIFNKHIGISEAVVMCTGTGAPASANVTNPIDTWVANMWYLPVDKERIIGEIPKWEYISFVDSFGDLLKQKIYTNNTSVALIALLGKLKNIDLVGDAANDPEIEVILDKVYEEINEALIKGLGINKESQLKFAKRAKAKYQDKEIIDENIRIIRDPIRKLGPEDRLIGPAKIAMKIGVVPKAISLAIAAALYYYNPEDEASVKLQNMRKEYGVDYILKNICKLESEDPLVDLIHESINDLKKKKWIV